MRMIVFAIAIVLVCSSCTNDGRTTTLPPCRKLSCVDSARARTLLDISIGDIIRQFDDTLQGIHTMSEPPLYLSTVVLEYTDGYHVYVGLDTVVYQSRYSDSMKWDSTLLLKETASSISIFRGSKSLVGGYSGLRNRIVKDKPLPGR